MLIDFSVNSRARSRRLRWLFSSFVSNGDRLLKLCARVERKTEILCEVGKRQRFWMTFRLCREGGRMCVSGGSGISFNKLLFEVQELQDYWKLLLELLNVLQNQKALKFHHIYFLSLYMKWQTQSFVSSTCTINNKSFQYSLPKFLVSKLKKLYFHTWTLML